MLISEALCYFTEIPMPCIRKFPYCHRGPRGPQTMQAIVIAIGCLPYLDSQTLLQKTPHSGYFMDGRSLFAVQLPIITVCYPLFYNVRWALEQWYRCPIWHLFSALGPVMSHLPLTAIKASLMNAESNGNLGMWLWGFGRQFACPLSKSIVAGSSLGPMASAAYWLLPSLMHKEWLPHRGRGLTSTQKAVS